MFQILDISLLDSHFQIIDEKPFHQRGFFVFRLALVRLTLSAVASRLRKNRIDFNLDCEATALGILLHFVRNYGFSSRVSETKVAI